MLVELNVVRHGSEWWKDPTGCLQVVEVRSYRCRYSYGIEELRLSKEVSRNFLSRLRLRGWKHNQRNVREKQSKGLESCLRIAEAWTLWRPSVRSVLTAGVTILLTFDSLDSGTVSNHNVRNSREAAALVEKLIAA